MRERILNKIPLKIFKTERVINKANPSLVISAKL